MGGSTDEYLDIVKISRQKVVDIEFNFINNKKMEKSSIYSIGHGNKNINEFISELKSFDIKYLLDIRSKPFSKWNPQFNKHSLKKSIEEEAVKYLFIGDLLGGLPNDKDCYDENGKVSYKTIKNKKFFIKGLSRIITANEKNIKVALMCSESNPEDCHRSKLIGEELLKNNKISMNHILSKEKIKSQELVINELTKGKSLKDIFGNEINLTSRKSY